MRDFFINSLETLVTVFVVLMLVIVLVSSVGTMFSQGGGFFQGIGMLIGGGISVILSAGVLFLALGIYQNTKRTAEMVEKLANK